MPDERTWIYVTYGQCGCGFPEMRLFRPASNPDHFAVECVRCIQMKFPNAAWDPLRGRVVAKALN